MKKNKTITLKTCVNRFCKSAKTRIMESTIQAYESRLVYLYSSPLANVKMSDLKGAHIIEWIAWLKNHETAQNKHRKTFLQEFKLLRVILNWYKNFLNEDFHIPITKQHKKMCIFKYNSPRRPDYFIKPEDARKWVNYLREHINNPVYWQLALFMLLTGVRISEACGLKWSSVEENKVRIIRRVRWDYKTKHPVLENITKTNEATRIIILPQKIQSLFSQMRKDSFSHFVFTNRRQELLKYNAIQSIFNNGFKALKLPWRSTHICRHTYATMALMGTKNLSAVQASLGHSQQKITERYAKALIFLNSDIGEKTSSVLFSKTSE